MRKIEIIKNNEIIFKSYGNDDDFYIKFDYYNLRNANLRNADLRNADLRNADLRNTDLSNADLRNANLRNADLSNADLINTDLSNADLRNADLRNADLSNADLRNADLRNADLFETKLDKKEEIRKGLIVNEKIYGYKKAIDKDGNRVLVKLEIAKGAMVFSINNYKCRTNKCKVLEIENSDYAYSNHDKDFEYKKGKEIEIKDFNLMYNIECASGIHFFRTREEAEDYNL